MSNIDVSIVTPFYKGNKYMDRLFACIRKNACTAGNCNIEFILINDSPNEKVHYLNEWCEGFRLKLITNGCNVGIQQSRINGILAASGKYVILLDQDDILEDYAICSQMACIGDADIVVANGVDENPHSSGLIYSSIKHQSYAMDESYYYTIGNMIVSPGQCMIRKEAIPQLWFEKITKYNGSDDFLLWLLLFQTKCKWEINPEVIYMHLNTGENVSSDYEKMMQSAIEVLNILKASRLVSPANERKLRRRFKMMQIYYGRNVIKKIAAYVCYPDIASKIIRMRKS